MHLKHFKLFNLKIQRVTYGKEYHKWVKLLMYSNNSYTPLVYKKKIVKAFLNQRAVGGGTNTAKLHRKTHKQHTVVTE